MAEFEIELQLNFGDEDVLGPHLTKIAKATLTQQQVNSAAVLTILVTDDAQLHELNRTYRKEDKPTDVLSFEDGTVWPDGKTYLGDIAISYETADRQATAGGHSLLDEMALLTAHGVLHLLGHDHGEPDEKAVMWQAQDEILGEFGITVRPVE